MKKKRNGCIINITHPGGKAPGAQSMPTSVSRAAGIAFTKALSHDMAPHNIRVNTVCLTNIISAQSLRAWKTLKSPLNYEDWCVKQGKNVPLGRLGEAREVADLVTFLVSDRGAFITGTSINIAPLFSNFFTNSRQTTPLLCFKSILFIALALINLKSQSTSLILNLNRILIMNK